MLSAIRFLVGETEPQDFFREKWTKVVHTVKGDSDRNEWLLTWDSFSGYLSAASAAQSPQTIRMVVEGELVPFARLTVADGKVGDPLRRLSPSLVEEACKRGGTLVVRAVDSITPGLLELTQVLRKEMGLRVTANAYYSQTQTRGFGAHYDAHEVFVLQIEGSKTWHLGGFTQEFPTEESVGKTAPRAFDEKVRTERGDVLYIPRGMWHYARAHEGPSLHVTIGVYPLTGLDAVARIVEQASVHPELRAEIGEWRDGTYAPSLEKIAACLRVLKRECEEVTAAATAAAELEKVSQDKTLFSLPFGL